jgi:hypothetical protein
MGSAGTLISGIVLKSLTFRTPLSQPNNIVGLKIHQEPVPNNKYAMTVDTSRGKGLDYSAFVVIDVTEIPYKVVCTYKDNDISPVVYPSIIKRIGTYYNEAFVLVEINDNGAQISYSLFDDYEYENLLSTVEANKKVSLTWANNKAERGIRTTKSVKRLGCSLMKSLIESYKLIVEDFDIITELSTFINKGTSYEADDGSHDDLVMCLVLFAWMTNQQFFSELCDTNIREKLYREQMNQIEDESLPMPYFGPKFTEEERFVSDGAVWSVVKP